MVRAFTIMLVAFAVVIILGFAVWYLTVYGPMELQSQNVNLEAQMQAILNRQTGEDIMSFEEFIKQFT